MFIENIIIGSGPSGIQLAYFYKKHNIPYVVLERESACASFFDKYPHTKELISINKKYTGSTNKDFNLRHDWNSLLNDEDLNFTDYSDDYYPKSNDLYKYLNDFKINNNLNVEYNINVIKIHKTDDNIYQILTNDKEKTYTCNNLIIATGLSLPNRPDNIILQTTDR